MATNTVLGAKVGKDEQKYCTCTCGERVIGTFTQIIVSASEFNDDYNGRGVGPRPPKTRRNRGPSKAVNKT